MLRRCLLRLLLLLYAANKWESALASLLNVIWRRLGDHVLRRPVVWQGGISRHDVSWRYAVLRVWCAEGSSKRRIGSQTRWTLWWLPCAIHC